MTGRLQIVRLTFMAAVLFGHFLAFLTGYYYGRVEGMAEFQHEAKAGRGWWDTAGPSEEE